MSSSNPFDTGNSAPSLSFAESDPISGSITSKPIGTKYVGRVTEEPKEVQARVYEGPDKGNPAFWPDGNPKKTVVIGLEVNGEDRTLWAAKPSGMFTAVKEALQQPDGSIRAIKVGDTLSVELVGFKKPEPGKAAQKIYKVVVTPGNVFADEAPTQAAAPATAAAATATAASATSGLSLEEQLAAAKAAKFAALSPEDQAKVATLSDEDRALLGV